MKLVKGYKLGPYEIESLVGVGGMGEVYRAKDTRLDRTVAIKILPQHSAMNADARARFDREARTISCLNHPNICTLHDVGHQDGIDYLVMEFLEGETLDSRLKRGKLDTAEALEVGTQIAEALVAAHKQELVHRDLKPGNILLTNEGAKLLDFGLAKFQTGVVTGVSDETQATPVTGAGTFVGTLQYMSPEQLEGREADVRSDIFSFGATLYEMLTGQRAFSGDSNASLIGSIMKDAPESISNLLPTAPPAFDRLIHKCLKKEPENRWQTAKDLKDELEWIASVGESTAIGRAGTDRIRPVMQIALMLLFIIASTSTFLWLRADKEHARAVKGQRFLSDVLTSSFPYGYGDKTTVLDILDKASEKLNESFLNEPKIEGELRQALGMGYSRIGHYREAKRELTSSLALYERALGVTDDRTLNLLTDLYRLNRVIGDGDEMLNIANKLVATVEDRFGADHEETFREKTTVAYAMEVNGEIGNAVATMEEAWRGFKNVIKSDTSAIISAQVQYAWLLLKQGEHSESKRLSHEALNIANAAAESYHIRDAQSVLAASHIVLGEIDSAKALYDYRKMPETFGIERVFQGQFDLADGRFQLLVFFETWCPFSKQKMAHLGKIDRQYSQYGLDIIGLTRVNRGANEEEVDEYLKNLDVDFTVVKETGRSWNYFECDGTPSIRLIHDGYLVWERRYYSNDPISTQMLEGIASIQSDDL